MYFYILIRQNQAVEFDVHESELIERVKYWHDLRHAGIVVKIQPAP